MFRRGPRLFCSGRLAQRLLLLGGPEQPPATTVTTTTRLDFIRRLRLSFDMVSILCRKAGFGETP